MSVQGDVKMDIQTVSITLAGIGIFIAAINFIVTSRKADQHRQMVLFLGVYNRFSEDDFVQAVHSTEVMDVTGIEWPDPESLTKFARENPDIVTPMRKLAIYFEGVDVLVDRGLFSLDLIEDLMGNTLIAFWNKFGPLYEVARQYSHPSEANQVETLYHAVVDLKQKKYPTINS
jgi:hypothetical protein